MSLICSAPRPPIPPILRKYKPALLWSFVDFVGSLGITLLLWQIDECLNFLQRADPAWTGKRSVCWNWGRGMSKTFLATIIACYIAYAFGGKTNFLVVGKPQLDQPKEYLALYKNYLKVAGEWARYKDRKKIHLAPMTFNSSSSGRYDIVIVDEAAGLVFYPAKERLVTKAQGVLSNSPIQLTLYCSTPIVGSYFHKIYKEHKADGDVSHRNYLNTSPNFCNPKDIDAKRIEWHNLGLDWMFESEYLAEWTVAGSKAYPNLIIESDFLFNTPLSWGIDFHGDYGQVCVGWWWTSIEENIIDVYAMREIRKQQGDEEPFNLAWIANLGGYVYVEGGARKSDGKIAKSGFNAGYMQEARKYGAIAVGNDAGSQSERHMNALKLRIHVCARHTPLLLHDLESAIYEDPVKMKILKDEDHPNHYLDAGEIGLPNVNVSFVTGGNKYSTKSIVQRERERDMGIRY